MMVAAALRAAVAFGVGEGAGVAVGLETLLATVAPQPAKATSVTAQSTVPRQRSGLVPRSFMLV
jgi:hypothetical protein